MKVEEFDSVELGWTGPSERRERAKSGSEASSAMARDGSVSQCRIYTPFQAIITSSDGSIHSSLLPLACDCGWTVGPGAVGWPAGGGAAEGALVVTEGDAR